MENVHAERSAGWSAICYVAVLLLASLLTSPMPPVSTPPTDLSILVDAHRQVILWAAWLTFPASAFFLWFLVGLRGYLRCAPGRQEGLPAFATLAGVVMVTQSLLSASLETAVGYASPDVFQANGFAALFGAFQFLQGGLGYAPVAIFLFAAAHSMRRHESAPQWLAWLGYLAALGCGIATLSIFYSSSFMAPNGIGPSVFGALPSAVWLIATGVVLVRTKGRSGEVPAGAPAP
ncbi:MAG TPA: hypothetical protein VJP76_07860 [Candidatus Tumulicola sp.]|nr:hypothetical protein [Candidatus Tumulicola sp.]